MQAEQHTGKTDGVHSKGNKEVNMGESKTFESGGFVVTTERFVYGSKVIRLDDIKGGALPL